jgi:hypothetical protein
MIRAETDRLIRQAIGEKRLIRFVYQNKLRIAEPHDYGVQNGEVRLLSYQVGGESNSGFLPSWRLVSVDRMTEVNMEIKTFPGSRGPDSTKHYRWDELYARVA